MGSYTFTWPHTANEVHIAGSFESWKGSVQLSKKGDIFEKTVDLPSTEKVLYKFIVDGVWKHDPTGKTETDHDNNTNNVLYPEDIKPHGILQAAAAAISSIAPGATTTAMAGKQPVERTPGAFPETPAAVEEKKEAEQTFSVNPIPATGGFANPITLAPGEKVPEPSTITNNTIASTVHDDPSLKSSAQDTEQTFSVAPIPATGGIGNPVHLQPGEKVPDPSTITANTLTSNVKLDQASYEKSDSGAPQIRPVLSPTSEKEALGAAPIFSGLGPQTTNMIPESSMGMGKDTPAPIDGVAISSVGATSTTNQLAGQVPLEPRGVPEVVSDSQKEAHVSPEASANPTAVEEKKEVENELKAKVPEENAGSTTAGGIAGAVTGGLAGIGAAAATAAYTLNQRAKETTGTDAVAYLPQSVQNTINDSNKKSDPAVRATAGDGIDFVPTEVKESQKEAHVDPEASANPEAVKEKSEAEKELLKKVPETEASGEPAPTATAAITATAPVSSTTTSGAPQLADPVGGGLAPISMDNKPSGSKELNAPAGAQAQTPATRANELATSAGEERDVSPMTKTAGQSEPTVTTGVDSATAPSTSKPVGTQRNGQSASTPTKRNSILGRIKGTPDSQTTAPDSEGKKKGFFTKLKEKLKQ